MNRKETITWIELILDSLDKHEMMAIIRESSGQFDGEFFETINSEIERYTTENEHDNATHLQQIARTIATVRQNRTENL